MDGQRVLVTGGGGRIGTAVVAELESRGAVAVSADAPDVDLTDPDAAVQVMAGIDSVVHLAAIPSPEEAPWPQVFANNVTSTFNVLWAAGEAGVGRAVIASSINASGMPFNSHDVLPAYFPFDEEAPADIDDPYSLSKVVDEQTARMVHRHWGMNIVALRFPYTAEAANLVEHADNLTRQPADGVRQGWTYLDVRDAAVAVALGLTRPVGGVPVIFVSAPDIAAPYATEALLDRFAPDVPRRRRLPGRAVPADLTRAETILGFSALHRLDLPLHDLPPNPAG